MPFEMCTKLSVIAKMLFGLREVPGRTVLKCGLRLLQSDKFSFSDFFRIYTSSDGSVESMH